MLLEMEVVIGKYVVRMGGGCNWLRIVSNVGVVA
jgi:hypothetical protein